jgi:tetratricopeptide (TPR) repeat protein
MPRRTAPAEPPELANRLFLQGLALQQQDRLAEAAELWRHSLALAPDQIEAAYALGLAATALGDFAAADKCLSAALRLAPHLTPLYRALLATGRHDYDGDLLKRLEMLAQQEGALPMPAQIELHFCLARLYQAQGHGEQAFRHLLRGNRQKRDTVDYDEARHLRLFTRLADVFSPALLAAAEGSGNSSTLPIFVVGMPRSGTSLVEQILASHSAIAGLGELPDLWTLAHGLGQQGVGAFPEAIANLPRPLLAERAAAYVATLRTRAPAARRVVDKMPGNFQLVGLIKMMLPEAKVIHVRRDPVDTCLSCFAELFAGTLPYAYDLAELGRFYHGYQALMRHWHDLLPPGTLLDLYYEDLVHDSEGQSRRLIEFCGLEWEQSCLDFPMTKRVVRTASAAQVRRPITPAAIGRPRPDPALLSPLLSALYPDGQVRLRQG